jgi:hypothetical protein
MLPVIHHPTWRSITVILAMALWLAACSSLDLHDRLQRTGWWIVGGLVFFAVAIVLPEYESKRFLSRQSALGLMAFFVFQTAVELALQYRPSPFATLAALIAVPLVSYFGALFLIRGLRAAPQYPAEPESQEPPGETPADQGS